MPQSQTCSLNSLKPRWVQCVRYRGPGGDYSNSTGLWWQESGNMRGKWEGRGRREGSISLHPKGVRYKAGLFPERETMSNSQKTSSPNEGVAWNSVCRPASKELLTDHMDLWDGLHRSANGSHCYKIWKIPSGISGLDTSPLALIVKGSGNGEEQESTDGVLGRKNGKSLSSTIPAQCIMGNAR